MKCPQCGNPSAVLETRDAQYRVSRRRRECSLGHRFNTFEVYAPVHKTIKDRLRTQAQVIDNRVAVIARNVGIAHALHNGWQALAQRYGVDKTTVYRMAARGRAHIKLIKEKK